MADGTIKNLKSFVGGLLFGQEAELFLKMISQKSFASVIL